MGARAGSDERAECVCTGKPVGQAPVGARQVEVGTVGGRMRRWGWCGVGWGKGMTVGYGVWGVLVLTGDKE